MRDYVNEVMNGKNLIDTYAELSNTIIIKAHECNSNEDHKALDKLIEQKEHLKSLMAFEYMTNSGYFVEEKSGFRLWEK